MSFKSIIDGALGAATTCAFAGGQGGAVVAAGLSTAGFLFDLVFGIVGGVDDVDPMHLASTRQDLKDAVTALETHIDDAIKLSLQKNLIDSVAAIQQNMDIARDTAGQKGSDGMLNGPTLVWTSGNAVAFFDPVLANPSDLQKLIENLTAITEPDAYEVVLLCHTMSVFMVMCKMGQVWEVNDNFRAVQGPALAYAAALAKVVPLQKSWDAYEAAHPGSLHGKRPADPPLGFVAPAAGDPAVGSWDPSQANVPASYLGFKHSAFANQLRGYLKTCLAWAEPHVIAMDKAWEAARITEENKRLAVTVQQTGGYWGYAFTDPSTGASVTRSFDSQEMTNFQAEFYRGSFREADWAKSIDAIGRTVTNPEGTKLGVLTRDDLDTLLKIMDTWHDVQNLYNGLATKGGKTPPADGFLI